MSTIICHHCGRDFYREFWTDADPGDQPRKARAPSHHVCDTCCRDTNPNCAPSAWVAPIRAVPTVDPQCLYTVAKKCYECGTEWEGKAFTPQPEGAPRLPGMCWACIAKDELRIAALTRPVVDVTPKDTDLERPRPVHEVDEDQGFPRPRLVGEVE